MIVNRRTFTAKPGRAEELAAMIVAEIERVGAPGRTRVYVVSIGRFDEVAAEWEYEGLEEYERDWAEWDARPETPEFLEKFFELLVPGGTNEIWELIE